MKALLSVLVLASSFTYAAVEIEFSKVERRLQDENGKPFVFLGDSKLGKDDRNNFLFNFSCKNNVLEASIFRPVTDLIEHYDIDVLESIGGYKVKDEATCLSIEKCAELGLVSDENRLIININFHQQVELVKTPEGC